MALDPRQPASGTAEVDAGRDHDTPRPVNAVLARVDEIPCPGSYFDRPATGPGGGSKRQQEAARVVLAIVGFASTKARIVDRETWPVPAIRQHDQRVPRQFNPMRPVAIHLQAITTWRETPRKLDANGITIEHLGGLMPGDEIRCRRLGTEEANVRRVPGSGLKIAADDLQFPRQRTRHSGCVHEGRADPQGAGIVDGDRQAPLAGRGAHPQRIACALAHDSGQFDGQRIGHVRRAHHGRQAGLGRGVRRQRRGRVGHFTGNRQRAIHHRVCRRQPVARKEQQVVRFAADRAFVHGLPIQHRDRGESDLREQQRGQEDCDCMRV